MAFRKNHSGPARPTVFLDVPPGKRNADTRKSALNGRITKRQEDAPSMHELIVNLNRAQTLKAITDTVEHYCGKTFHSRAGMIFLARNGDLQRVSQWRSRQISKKYLDQEIIQKGPVARAFRTGLPVFWNVESMPHSKISRLLHRWLRRCRCRSAAFFPISAPGQRPSGVLVILLPYPLEHAVALSDDLSGLGQVVSECVERARAYDEALTARDKAEDMIQSKDEFFSMLSHELKNSMMPILGWAVALSSGTLPQDKQNFALEGIVRNIRTLNCMIEDLFDAARISSGRLCLQTAEIRIQDVAREALTAIQHTVESKKIRVAAHISEAIPAFIADSRRLQQVLVNLLNNAVKFTPPGGSITLRVDQRGNSVECVVADTGKGIEPKFLPFVFDRFRQENRRSKVYVAGLGLGLAIAHEIVELHGGSIRAFSEGSERGSTFRVRLPLRKKHVAERAHHRPRSNAA